MKWKRQHTPLSPTRIDSFSGSRIPIGSFVETERGTFYVKSETERLYLISNRVLESWSPQRIFVMEENHAAVKKMRIVSRLKFRNGSLIHNVSDGKVYLIESGLKRHLVSPDAFSNLGLNPKEARHSIMDVSMADTELHQPGEVLEE